MKTEKILGDHEKRITNLEKYIIEDGKTSKGKDVTCEHCGYSWRTTSKMEKTSCPNCPNKVTIDKSKLPENYDVIRLHFGKSGKECTKCKTKIRNPKEAEYRHPNIYCKKCFKKLNKADLKEIEKGLKKIL